MMENAQIAIMIGIGVAQEMSDDEIIEAMDEILNNKKDEDGHYIHSYYESDNRYTPMIESIMGQYKEKGVMTPKQRNALNNHYSIHGRAEDAEYGLF